MATNGQEPAAPAPHSQLRLRNAIDNIGAEKLSSNATLKAIIAELPRSALRKPAALKAALTPASRDVLDDL